MKNEVKKKKEKRKKAETLDIVDARQVSLYVHNVETLSKPVCAASSSVLLCGVLYKSATRKVGSRESSRWNAQSGHAETTMRMRVSRSHARFFVASRDISFSPGHTRAFLTF